MTRNDNNEMTLVFVNLSEGVDVFVGCESVKLQNDIYRIIKNEYYDPEDKTAIWKFKPGDTVRCEYQPHKNPITEQEDELLVAVELVI